MPSGPEQPMADNNVLVTAKNEVDALRISLMEYFASSKYSDLIIRCEGQEFKVHKIVPCGQSSYFSKACDGEWKEADGVIDLKEDDVHVVEAMLRYLYTSDYDASGNNAQKQLSPMIFNIRVYVMADKYDIPALKTLAKAKFEKDISTGWNMDDFAHAIAEVYSSTLPADRGLRNPVVEIVHEHLNELLKDDGFVDVLERTVGFAADVIQLVAQGKSAPRKYKCASCYHTWEAVLSPAKTYRCMHCGNSYSDWENYVAE